MRALEQFAIVLVSAGVIVGGFVMVIFGVEDSAMASLKKVFVRSGAEDLLEQQARTAAVQRAQYAAAVKTRVQMDLPDLGPAPELTGLGTWHNGGPLKLAELKGKVIFVNFWTLGCINCIHAMPSVVGYAQTFKDQPFIVLGIHTPEFPYEKLDDNVSGAIKRLGITFPVAQDNDYATWKAFGNNSWPAAYIIDSRGHIRYSHFGEGNYEEMENVIAQLVEEAKSDSR